MGIDITGMSKARRVAGRHSDDVCEDEEHIPAGSCRKYLDGLKSGCYVSKGTSHFLYFSYGGFDAWQNALSQIIYDLPSSEVAGHPRRFKGKPFVELIAFPFHNDVGFGPVTSAKLHADFQEHSATVKKGFQRLATDAVANKGIRKKRPARSKNYTAGLADSLAKALGGMVVGGDDHPQASDWEWQWEAYQDFRRAFRLASNDGILIMSI